MERAGVHCRGGSRNDHLPLQMGESCRREEKWSPHIASDEARLKGSLLTQRFDEGGPEGGGAVSGVII